MKLSFYILLASGVMAGEAASEPNIAGLGPSLAEDLAEPALAPAPVEKEVKPEEAPAQETKSSPEPEYKPTLPFEDPMMHTIGCFLMTFLIGLSNAGGLSGAGSNIPIMLILFNMNMKEAVPISGFVAVCATFLRFGLGWNKTHPHSKERTAINYEVVQITMPAVFMGSLIGVILNGMTSETLQVSVFGVTVAWSVWTTLRKALQLREKENKAADAAAGKASLIEPVAVAQEVKEEEQAVTASSPELAAIMHEEKYHFTCKRCGFLAVSFAALFVTQSLTKSSLVSVETKRYVYLAFALVTLLLTTYSIRSVKYAHEIKNRDGYSFHETDMRFDSICSIITLAIVCGMAAALCGLTGIAGGMVLGPLFLSYNMLPTVMSGTNQYITMVASISVVLQFLNLGALNVQMSLLFGALTLVSAYSGLRAVDYYMAKSGRQSIIAFILAGCLIFALTSLPLNYLLKAHMAKKQLN